MITKNMKNTIIIIALVSIGLLGLMWWGAQNTATVSSFPREYSGPSAAPGQSETVSALVASEKLYDFGTISMAKGNVTHTFAVTNPTDKDILVSNLTTSCMCTTAYIVEGNSKIGPFGMPGMGFAPKANMLIKAGGTRRINVVY